MIIPNDYPIQIDSTITLLHGDCLTVLPTLPAQSFNCCITSPPYFNLRNYATAGQLGQEATPEEYIRNVVMVFREVKRLIRDDGTLWLNIGDCYRAKDRLLIPARVALALQADGWLLRDEIIWHKPRTTPAPVKDRTVAAHEYIYMFAKSSTYYYDYLSIEEPSKYAGDVKDYTAGTQKNVGNVSKAPGSVARKIVVRDTRRKRSVWSISPQPSRTMHFACFPADLITPCILAGCPPDGTILDPFGGSGTTGLVARKHGRRATLIEINQDSISIARNRL
jgi:site-specific DNA-methyltransferase (adenine-specific)